MEIFDQKIRQRSEKDLLKRLSDLIIWHAFSRVNIPFWNSSKKFSFGFVLLFEEKILLVPKNSSKRRPASQTARDFHNNASTVHGIFRVSFYAFLPLLRSDSRFLKYIYGLLETRLQKCQILSNILSQWLYPAWYFREINRNPSATTSRTQKFNFVFSRNWNIYKTL